ncbi:hypothetical protein I4U23_001229 [Adineta vaga]|nr:hypothetical protein I4U23_001229 [Adineta vaga]
MTSYKTPRATCDNKGVVSAQLHELAERLQIARIDDDYVETDLSTWKTMLQEL